MRLSHALALLAAALSPLGAAELIIGQETCITSYASSSVLHVPTHTTRQTILLTIISTKTKFPLTTVTPTSTVTSTSVSVATITQAQFTNTITATQTATTTSTLTVDITDSQTVTQTLTTTEPPTVTASVASNFTPFASESAVIAAGGGSVEKRDAKRVPRRGLTDLVARGKKQSLLQAKYPSSVKCIVFIDDISTRTSTVSAKTTKTRTAVAVVSVDTITDTITSTVVPTPVGITVTSTTTLTSLTLDVQVVEITSTASTTSTVFAGATQTYYPQCQSDNLIEFVGGVPLYDLSSDSLQLSTAPDAATCCQLCANTAGCAGFSGPISPFTDCYTFGDLGTCDASISDWTVNPADADQTSDFDVVGNGNCGQGTYAGAT